MTQEQQDKFLEYLGELLSEHEATHDYFSKSAIEEKIKAMHIILELPYEKQ